MIEWGKHRLREPQHDRMMQFIAWFDNTALCENDILMPLKNSRSVRICSRSPVGGRVEPSMSCWRYHPLLIQGRIFLFTQYFDLPSKIHTNNKSTSDHKTVIESVEGRMKYQCVFPSSSMRLRTGLRPPPTCPSHKWPNLLPLESVQLLNSSMSIRVTIIKLTLVLYKLIKWNLKLKWALNINMSTGRGWDGSQRKTANIRVTNGVRETVAQIMPNPFWHEPKEGELQIDRRHYSPCEGKSVQGHR